MKTIMKTPFRLLCVALLLLAGYGTQAQTFVKEIFGVGNIEPRVFKDAGGSRYFVTSRINSSPNITLFDAAGNILLSHDLQFPGDVVTITDMIVDNIDGTLAGVARGTNRNYVFKYDYGAFAFNWVRSFPNTYVFQNIHQVNATNYVVTGEILSSQTTIFEISRAAGTMGYQRAGFVGEFFSTFDGTDIYGACRYYTTGSLFNPSLYRYNAATGTNTWTNTYVMNPPTTTCRIYPVAPIVDNNSLLQLSSGDDAGFGLYTSGPTDAWLLSTDLAGTLAWTKNITIPGYTSLNAKQILNTATGYYLLIDAYNTSSSMVDYFFVVKTDKNGNYLWANRYGISGVNSVISGVEDNGFLYLTVLSGSYAPGSNLLYLKLDQNGMSDPSCPYIRVWSANVVKYTNTTAAKGTATNTTAYGPGTPATTLATLAPSDNIQCATSSNTLPCNTLTGSLATGVVAFYPFGNGSLLDVSGNNNHLTVNSGAVPTFGHSTDPNCAYRFFGTSFLSATSAAFVNGITSAPFSISLWYQPLNTRPVGNYELLIGRGNTPLHCPDTWGEWSVGLYDCRKAVVGFDMNSHWETPVTSLTCSQYLTAISNTWHHLAFVYDGSSGYDLYIDGVLYSNIHGPCGPMSSNLGPLMLGVDYDGDLDDVIIYNRAITPAEVAALMALNGSCCDGVSSSQKSSTSVEDHNVKFTGTAAVTVYPNPASNEVTVSAGKDIIRKVAIYSNTGALVNMYNFDKTGISIDIDHLAPGVYFMKVTTDAGMTTEKLIKK